MNKNLDKTIFNRNTGLIAVIAENKMAVFTLSGSLKRSSTSVSEVKNNFDKDKVQQEIDLQVAVTQEFGKNVKHFQTEQLTYLTDKAITSQTNQNDNSKVLIKKRSDWFEK